MYNAIRRERRPRRSATQGLNILIKVINALPYGEVATPVSPVGAIIDRPHQSASVNVPAISVGRAESARRFVRLKLIFAAA